MPDFRYLSLEEVVFLHDEIVKATGGSLGVRDLNLLSSAVMRPQASFGGEDLYTSIFDKAACLMHSLVLNHAFVDGKKRTGLAAASLLLEVNGYFVDLKLNKTFQFVLKITKEKLSVEQIADWLKKHSTKG